MQEIIYSRDPNYKTEYQNQFYKVTNSTPSPTPTPISLFNDANAYSFRLNTWDTFAFKDGMRVFPDGLYRVTVTAYDAGGNYYSTSQVVEVKNAFTAVELTSTTPCPEWTRVGDLITVTAKGPVGLGKETVFVRLYDADNIRGTGILKFDTSIQRNLIEISPGTYQTQIHFSPATDYYGKVPSSVVAVVSDDNFNNMTISNPLQIAPPALSIEKVSAVPSEFEPDEG